MFPRLFIGQVGYPSFQLVIDTLCKYQPDNIQMHLPFCCCVPVCNLLLIYSENGQRFYICTGPISNIFLKNQDNITKDPPMLEILEFDDSQITQWLDFWRSIPGNRGSDINFENLKKRIVEFKKELPEKDLFKLNEQLLVAHFFKVKEKEKLTFIEFAHKSFKEYLVAEKIFSFFQESISKKSIDEVRWLSMGRMLPQDEEFRFLQDLLNTLKNEELAWLYGEFASGNKLHMLISLGSFRRLLGKINFPYESEIGTIYYRPINLSCLAYIVSNMIYSLLKFNWEKLSEVYAELRTNTPAKRNSTKYVYHICHSTPGSHSTDSLYTNNWLTAKKFMNSIDLSTVTLDGIDFSLAELNEANFSETSLKRCSFENANPILADFSNANCHGTDFSGSFCSNTIFSGATLHQVTFRNAEIYFGKFENSKLVNIDFSGTRLENCDFTGSRWKNVLYNPEKIKNCRGLPKVVENRIKKQH